MRPTDTGTKPNETIEAYTGNHVARKGGRTPPGLVHDSLDKSRDESSEKQMAMALTGQKPTQRARYGECSEGLPGSKERGMRGEKCQGLGRPWWLPDIGRERGV